MDRPIPYLAKFDRCKVHPVLALRPGPIKYITTRAFLIIQHKIIADTKLNMLSARYPHVVSIDPSEAAASIQEGYTQGYINTAMLTLVMYNACYVARFRPCFMRSTYRDMFTVTTFDKEVCIA